MAALVYKDSSGNRIRFILEREQHSIGRHASNDLVLQDALVSRKHCLIERNGESYKLVDLGSSYGTYVNDDRVEGAVVLKFGDKVRIGNLQLKYVLENAEGTRSSDVTSEKPDVGATTDSGRPPLTDELDEVRRTVFALSDFLKALPEASRAPISEITELIDRLKILRAAMVDFERNRILAQTLAEVGKLIHLLKNLDTILEVTLDLAVRAIGGDRGYILLRDDADKLAVRVSRNMGDMRGISSSIAEQVVAGGEPIITDDAQVDPRYNRAESVMMNAIRAVICVPLRSRKENLVFGAIYVDGRPGGNIFDDRALGFLKGFSNHAGNAIESVRMEAKTALEVERRERLSRYFSEAVIADIMDGSEGEKLGGDSRQVTILFTDIRGFTAMLEKLKPAEAVEMLNEYFTEIVDEILTEEGTLDKFTGDGIMAFWGAPKAQPDHALRAVRAALKIQARLPALMARWRREERSFIREVSDLATGIGINSGEAVVGNIGSPKRMEYTAIGDAVNLTARVQGLAAGGEVLITQATLDVVAKHVMVQPLEAAQLKGKSQPVALFRVTAVV